MKYLIFMFVFVAVVAADDPQKKISGGAAFVVSSAGLGFETMVNFHGSSEASVFFVNYGLVFEKAIFVIDRLYPDNNIINIQDDQGRSSYVGGMFFGGGVEFASSSFVVVGVTGLSYQGWGGYVGILFQDPDRKFSPTVSIKQHIVFGNYSPIGVTSISVGFVFGRGE